MSSFWELLKAVFELFMIFPRFVWATMPVFWPLWLIVFGKPLVLLIIRIVRFVRLRRAGMPEIDRMSGEEFERKLAILFRQRGYKVELTPYQGDWGADLVIARDGRQIVVQAKRWNQKVDLKAVQEVVAAKAKYGCQDAMVVTNSHFTKATKELARVNNVELWDRQRLAKEILAVGKRKSGEPDDGDRPNPECFKCGREMVLKDVGRGPFWACPGYPKCRNAFPAKDIEGASMAVPNPEAQGAASQSAPDEDSIEGKTTPGIPDLDVNYSLPLPSRRDRKKRR